MEENIITSDKPSSSSSPLNPNASRIICHVCQKQFSQYTCPRCNSRYCSLHCYKTHSNRCTESFMKENVMGELQQLQPDDETKRKMLNILKRFHSEEEETDSMDEEDSILSEESIETILSGGNISFEDLSPAEKKHFQRAVASGELSKMIKPWEPWWLKTSAKTLSLSADGTHLVQPVLNSDMSDTSIENHDSIQTTGIPSGPETSLASINKLSPITPSPLLAIHLIDIIYSYCFTLRLYNGDYESDAIESAMVLLSISSVLGQGGLPETVFEVVSHCLEQTCSPAFKQIGGLKFGLTLLDDVINLLSLCRSGLICSLCDLERLVKAGEKELKSNQSKNSKRADIKSKLKLAERKIYFVMCWVNEQPEEAWSSIAAIVKAEKCSAIDFESGKNTVKRKDKAGNRGKVMIEEVQ